MMKLLQSVSFVCLSLTVVGAPAHGVLPSKPYLARRDLDGTSNVYLGNRTGSTNFLASGILLGLPLNGSQIPDHYLSDIGFNNMRSGGSQLGEPARGWTHGYEDFLVSRREEPLKSIPLAKREPTKEHQGALCISQVRLRGHAPPRGQLSDHDPRYVGD